MSDYASYSEDCDVRIVAIGHTGDGKSSTCCSIVMDEKAFDSSSGMVSEIKKCEHRKALVLGKNILVVDTPGLFDLKHTLNELGRCLLLSAPGPHAFIYVVQVGARFSKEYKETLAKFRELFGDECTKFMIVVFCGIDKFQYDRKIKSLEEYIGTVPPELRDLIHDCGNRYVGFNNRCDKTSEENRRQVERLLTEVDRIKELNRSKFNDCNSYYTTEMLNEAERIMKEKDENFKKEMEEKQKLARQSAPESELVQELREKQQKTYIQAMKREMELQLQLKLKDQQLERQRLRERSRQVVQKVDVAPPAAPPPSTAPVPAPVTPRSPSRTVPQQQTPSPPPPQKR